MKYEVNDIVCFNDKEYIVLDIIKDSSNTYLYLINNSEFEDDVAISKVVDDKFTYIDDEEEYNKILNKLFLDFKNNIISIATNE